MNDLTDAQAKRLYAEVVRRVNRRRVTVLGMRLAAAFMAGVGFALWLGAK